MPSVAESLCLSPNTKRDGISIRLLTLRPNRYGMTALLPERLARTEAFYEVRLLVVLEKEGANSLRRVY